MRRAMVLLVLLAWGAGARADEALLETLSVEELLGEVPAGLSVAGAQLWNGSLGELAAAAAALGEAVALCEGADPGVSVTLVSNAPVPASLARAAVAAACKRLAGGEEEGSPDLQVMITVVGAEQVTAMAALHRKLDLGGAVVEEVPDDGAVIVVTTDASMDLPIDPTALFDAMLRKPAGPVAVEGVEELQEGLYRVERAVVAPLLEDSARMARMVPSYRDGEMHGFKLFSIRPGSTYAALRIRNGDVLLRVGEESMDDIRGVETLFRAWLTRDEVALTVVRRGQEVVLRYEMVGEPLAIPQLWTLGPPTREQHMERHGVTLDGEVVVLPRAYVLSLRDTLAEEVHWQYTLDDAGAIVGMRGQAHDGNLLHLLGLRRGEYLAAVDDEPITTPLGLMRLFTVLRTRSDVILAIGGPRGVRTLAVRVEGEQDADVESWPLPLLDIAPTLAQTRVALGIVEQSGVLKVPREVVCELLEPLAEVRLVPTPVVQMEGYRLLYGDRIDRLAPLGLHAHDTIVALDGDPVVHRDAAEAVFRRMYEGEAMTLTVTGRGRAEETVALVFVGEAAALPSDWEQLQIEPTLDERRATAGVVVSGDRITLPRAVVIAEGHEVLHWRPVEAGDDVDGFQVPVRSRFWLSSYLDLRSGDVVLSFDGRDLDSDEARDALVEALLHHREVSLVVIRDGRPIDVHVVVHGDPVDRPDDWTRGRGRPRR